MSWYDPTSWGSTGKNVLNFVSPVTAFIPSTQGGVAKDTLGNNPAVDQERMRKALLQEQAQKSGGFADNAEYSYGRMGREAAAQRDYLGRLSRGEDSISAEQLRQGLQQNVSAQQSMAAGAPVRDQGVAARTAMINAGRLGSQAAGAQSLAGLQERQLANQSLANMIMTQRGQDVQAALGGRQTAVQGYGANNAGTPEKSWIEQYGPIIRDIAMMAAA